jgi:hypothetical protein
LARASNRSGSVRPACAICSASERTIGLGQQARGWPRGWRSGSRNAVLRARRGDRADCACRRPRVGFAPRARRGLQPLRLDAAVAPMADATLVDRRAHSASASPKGSTCDQPLLRSSSAWVARPSSATRASMAAVFRSNPTSHPPAFRLFSS